MKKDELQLAACTHDTLCKQPVAIHPPPLPQNRDWPCGSSLLTRGKYLGILQDSEGCGRTELAAEAAAEAAVHPQNKCQISNQRLTIGSDDVKQLR